MSNTNPAARAPQPDTVTRVMTGLALATAQAGECLPVLVEIIFCTQTG